MTTPTARTLALFRAMGYTCAVVERWNQYARVRQDVYGFGDILAMHPDHGIALLQACAGASHAARLDKVRAEPRCWDWLRAGGRVAVVSWRKGGPEGKRKLWTVRTEWVVKEPAQEAAT